MNLVVTGDSKYWGEEIAPDLKTSFHFKEFCIRKEKKEHEPELADDDPSHLTSLLSSVLPNTEYTGRYLIFKRVQEMTGLTHFVLLWQGMIRGLWHSSRRHPLRRRNCGALSRFVTWLLPAWRSWSGSIGSQSQTSAVRQRRSWSLLLPEGSRGIWTKEGKNPLHESHSLLPASSAIWSNEFIVTSSFCGKLLQACAVQCHWREGYYECQIWHHKRILSNCRCFLFKSFTSWS
jgi:hypothetical protein